MHEKPVVQVHSGVGMFWLMGYMFTIGYTKPDLWHALLGLLIWPYQLGVALKALPPVAG